MAFVDYVLSGNFRNYDGSDTWKCRLLLVSGREQVKDKGGASDSPVAKEGRLIVLETGEKVETSGRKKEGGREKQLTIFKGLKCQR